ncbi:hypothetical protein Taro_017282 [Colocasia esculenta]|uniref:Cytochrome P450 n=1 Tax=Colocasia esculenta TaxID=4460 RepID=A0A843UN86_COLES|nr:hypothetical protein [Colocasia esculenta]
MAAPIVTDYENSTRTAPGLSPVSSYHRFPLGSIQNELAREAKFLLLAASVAEEQSPAIFTGVWDGEGLMGSSQGDGIVWVWWGLGLLLLGWVVVQVVRAVMFAWWTPRMLERALRQQGIPGNSYRLLFGDIRESTRLREEAKLKPMPSFSHDIAARVAPLEHQAMETHGKVHFTWLGPYPAVNIMDPVLVREVLSNKFGHYQKQKSSPASRLLVTGLLTSEGEKWAMHRRIINPAFHVEKLKLMLPAFSACCTELLSGWEKLLGSERSCELDVWPELQNFTRDVISRTAFGSNYEEGRRIFQLQVEQLELVIQSFQNWLIPGYRYIPTKKNRRMREIYKEVNGILRDMITKREKAIQSKTTGNDDLLGLLLESNLTYFQENGDSKTFRMTTEDVIEECKLFYFAGQETTSLLLTWAMITLGMNPNWQDSARAEVLQVFGKNKPHFDGLSHLKIVTMILYEVLRLYPPAVFLRRSTHKTMKLGEYTLPPGVLLILPIMLIHHDPDFWGEDANVFNPERFAEGISKASKNQVAFFPFGGGPRICVGQSFAMIEAKLGLATILQHFSFELSPAYTHAPCTVGTLQPQHGAPLILHRL